MSGAGSFFVRWRVRLGYPLALVVLWFARPTIRSILLAVPVGGLGLLVRGLSAGHLHKQKVLTVTGPYAYTRNPLYLGSAFLTLAAAIAMHSWISAVILWVYFAVFYFAVMRREEAELRKLHGADFDRYAASVPLFFPRWRHAETTASEGSRFSLAQYRKNHEHQAAVGFLLLLAMLFLIHWLRAR
ncbi:MAG TPA: isoprenylcysteine carboxylmethyltransferase family protein [Candidatus Acidoferrum sp.]|nr:isoprenylcysteine carboxylmethyltransferase family protein [Candidatus Acidoferrum sp.]